MELEPMIKALERKSKEFDLEYQELLAKRNAASSEYEKYHKAAEHYRIARLHCDTAIPKLRALQDSFELLGGKENGKQK